MLSAGAPDSPHTAHRPPATASIYSSTLDNRHLGHKSTRRNIMKAIIVTNQAAGAAGMQLVERPEPPAAINDVIVQIHASGFVPTELAWPSTWTDRRDR